MHQINDLNSFFFKCLYFSSHVAAFYFSKESINLPFIAVTVVFRFLLKIELFTKIISDFQPSSIFVKSSILNV